jgi:NADH-quinone oxidoreductase subunit C
MSAEQNISGAAAGAQPLPAVAAAAQSPPVATAVASMVLAEARPNPLPHLSTPFQAVDYALKGYHLDASVSPDQVVKAAEELDREGFALDTITGVDWLAENQMEVVYDYFHTTKPLRAVVRTRIPRGNPELPTLSRTFSGANWHEREAHDFFGIRFMGHPDLTPFLLPEDATYHPLRKDFTT